jgi:hypothetical protein
MRAQRFKSGFHRLGAALGGSAALCLPLIHEVREYLTTRWWMPLVLFWLSLAGILVLTIQVLKWTGAIG